MSGMVTSSCGCTFPSSESLTHKCFNKDKKMNFKIGDRVKVSTIEDVGTVQEINITSVLVRWNTHPYGDHDIWYPAYQVRLAEEELKELKVRWYEYSTGKKWETRLSRKEIKKELEKLSNPDKLHGVIEMQLQGFLPVVRWTKRKEIRNVLRQLSAEAYCVDKVLAERIDKIADGV
jgi:hypothetical protein